MNKVKTVYPTTKTVVNGAKWLDIIVYINFHEDYLFPIVTSATRFNNLIIILYAVIILWVGVSGT